MAGFRGSIILLFKSFRGFALALVWAFAFCPGGTAQGFAQSAPAAPSPGEGAIRLSAVLAAGQTPVATGLTWRVFREGAEPDGTHTLIAQSTEGSPTLRVRDGDYVVHVAYGLASAMRRVSVRGQPIEQQLTLGAGVLQLSAVLGDANIPANRLQISIFVPERAGNEAKLILSDAKPYSAIRLPEGTYSIVSTYLDKEGAGTTPGATGRANATNSVVNTEVRVQAGKLTDVILRHHAATLTLKLVNTPGGEALANTSFSVLTPGGDVIRELIGAFPSLILAEGEYVVIARRDNKTYQGAVKVLSAVDHDVEVLAQ